jgi:hypothetical protein
MTSNLIHKPDWKRCGAFEHQSLKMRVAPSE